MDMESLNSLKENIKEHINLKIDPIAKNQEQMNAHMVASFTTLDAHISELKKEQNQTNVEMGKMNQRLEYGEGIFSDHDNRINNNTQKITVIEKKADKNGFRIGILWSGLGILSVATISSIVGFVWKVVPMIIKLALASQEMVNQLTQSTVP